MRVVIIPSYSFSQSRENLHKGCTLSRGFQSVYSHSLDRAGTKGWHWQR